MNVKMHKIPKDTRPITNLRVFLLHPAAWFLVEKLQVIVDRLPSVLDSSVQFVPLIESGIVPPSTEYVIDFDIEH